MMSIFGRKETLISQNIPQILARTHLRTFMSILVKTKKKKKKENGPQLLFL